jgi:hypothetical protein
MTYLRTFKNTIIYLHMLCHKLFLIVLSWCYFRMKRQGLDRDEKIILIPFVLLRLGTTDGEKRILVENHYICDLSETDRILLVSKWREGKRIQVVGEKKELCKSSGEEVLSLLIDGYRAVKTRVNELAGHERKSSGFAKGFIASELRRLFFGGYMQKPPIPRISDKVKLSFLMELYSTALGSKPEKTRYISSEFLYSPFRVLYRTQEFLALNKNLASYEKILSKLWRDRIIRP